jgi:hypothetical protein
MKLNIVPARTGLQWVSLGPRTFLQQPFALTALFFLLMAFVSMSTIVPLVGAAIALALLPLSTLVMMVAAEDASQGKRPMPTVLVSAWRAGKLQLRPMAVLGALYAGGFLLCMGISALFDGGQFAQLYLVGGKMTTETVQSADFQLAMWAFLALYLPLSLLFWHAPALVHWHGVPPVKSLFFSIVACWRNMGAFTLYGLAWMGVFALGGVLMSVLSALLIVSLGEAAAAIAAGVMVLAVMVMASMLFTSTYFTFRDCFTPTENGSAEA